MPARRFRSRHRGDERGAAAVEFALVSLFLIGLLLGILQYGWYFYSMNAGTTAVNEAARRMSVGDCQTSAGLKTMVRNRLGAGTSAASDAAITIATSYTKADGVATATSPGEVGGKLTLSATYPAMNIGGFWPLPDGGDITRTATARIEDVTATSAGACG